MTLSLTDAADPRESATAGADADLMAAHTLLGVLVREVAGPQQQTTVAGEHLVVRLPHTGRLLRARLRRCSPVAVHRFAPAPVELRTDHRWDPVDLERLAAMVGAELTVHTGRRNDEFMPQVTASRDALAEILRTRPARPALVVAGVAGAYLDSEQALLAGHPRHPAPKWRPGEHRHWRRYAPEARTAFPLRWLSVPAEHVLDHSVDAHAGFDEHACTAALLAGHQERIGADRRAVPVHPWQYRLLAADPELGPVLRAALARGALRDLGEVGVACHPTASVRTLYQPEADRFLKTSLNVRITNCLRKNAAYELAGAVALTRLLEGPCAEVAAAHPDFAVLAEPAARSVELPDLEPGPRYRLLEALGTIVRSGLREHVRAGERVHLAGTLAAEHPDPAGTGTRLVDLAARAGAADPAGWATLWWRRYLSLLVTPVLRLWAEHGVVLEPHPQNVLVVVGPDQLPVRVLARDLEGTKLVADRHADALAALPADVARAVGYDEARGWNRIAYCLFVNHLAEVAGALTDLSVAAGPDAGRFEQRLWEILAEVLAAAGAELGEPPRLRALLAGAPLPAKTNLLLRWERAADRHAGYVPFPNPMGRRLAEGPR
ncbi:IucA/IucC family protein [Pseudonocardia asaccharolytica]|uniref:Iron transporter n=1 Tax=Pseudonocardia asaccharolytica DSM 44247 = NBRC 16224 TaxID=1123024 RepID=A0A511CY36_9PSEU|nr:IucA/IucC family protein [Pseudonocardia asaccharolytica]GEL17480.1 iron transporter [Pseudonocardia asaccharolytica DSM 44247 = NBRC 16224]